MLSNGLDVPAWVLGLWSRYRWQVERFFRGLKATASFRQRLSARREAIAFEDSVAGIGTRLWALRGNARPSKDAYALRPQVAWGGASAAEILPILTERACCCALDRESQRQ